MAHGCTEHLSSLGEVLGHNRDLAAEDSVSVPSPVEAHYGSDALPASAMQLGDAAGSSIKCLQARIHFPLQKEMASAARAEAGAKVQGSPAALAGLKVPGELCGYCAAQGLTRAETRRQEGVKHLSCLICQL